jgi:hypothetical protein
VAIPENLLVRNSLGQFKGGHGSDNCHWIAIRFLEINLNTPAGGALGKDSFSACEVDTAELKHGVPWLVGSVKEARLGD